MMMMMRDGVWDGEKKWKEKTGWKLIMCMCVCVCKGYHHHHHHRLNNRATFREKNPTMIMQEKDSGMYSMY